MTDFPLYSGKTGPWEAVIGLEVHVQVKSVSKLFSGAATAFGAAPNAQVSFIDAGFPGMLPVLNRFCVQQAIRTGLGLHAAIHEWSLFDRKNYFYADLPQGYQISQYKHPIVGEGYLDIDLKEGGTRRIGIERLHLEQDAGKSIHDQHPDFSYIDLNRSGVALMEIVTKPDMRSAEEAADFVKKLRTLLRYLETSEANMEQGHLRADVNVSLRRPGEPLGTRAEIKNMNSMRFIIQAIHYEIQRQQDLLESGHPVVQETRLFDPQRGETRTMRSKENAHDYRYFPEPDLPPLVISQEEIQAIRDHLPELPEVKKKRFMTDLGLSAYDADLLTSEVETADFFEKSLSFLTSEEAQGGALVAAEELKTQAKLLANWLLVEVFALLNHHNLCLSESRVTPENLAHLVALMRKGTLSGRMAKDVFTEMWDTGFSPHKIVHEKGLEQISDTDLLDKTIDQILANNPKMVEEYKQGKDKLFGFFVGQVMKSLCGKANPQVVNTLLNQKLKS